MEILKRITALETESEAFGFYWPNIEAIFNQIKSELREVQAALEEKESNTRVQEEIGDLIHATLCLCIYMKFDVQETLTNMTDKYEKRFTALKEIAHEKGFSTLIGQRVEDKLKLWEEAKRQF